MPDIHLRALEAALGTDAINLAGDRFQVNGGNWRTLSSLGANQREAYDRVAAVAQALYPTLTAARTAMAGWIDGLLTIITGPVPGFERASWPTKAEAARAYGEDRARPDQIAMLEGEAEISNRTVADLAAVIIQRADRYEAIIARCAGLRVALNVALEDATDPTEYEAILENGKIQAADLIASLDVGVSQ